MRVQTTGRKGAVKIRNIILKHCELSCQNLQKKNFQLKMRLIRLLMRI